MSVSSVTQLGAELDIGKVHIYWDIGNRFINPEPLINGEHLKLYLWMIHVWVMFNCGIGQEFEVKILGYSALTIPNLWYRIFKKVYTALVNKTFVLATNRLLCDIENKMGFFHTKLSHHLASKVSLCLTK